MTADDTKIPTSGAIVNYVTELGAGDMQKAVYDKNNTGIVDDAEKLGGVAPEEYLQKASLPDATVAFDVAETRSNISTGEKVSTVFGKIKKFFADLTAPAFAQMITTKEDLLATKVTGYVPDAKAVADTYTELNGKLTIVSYSNSQFVDNWGDFEADIQGAKYGKVAIITLNIALKTGKQMSTGEKWTVRLIPDDLIPLIKPVLYYKTDDIECIFTIENNRILCEVGKGTLIRKALYFSLIYLTN